MLCTVSWGQDETIAKHEQALAGMEEAALSNAAELAAMQGALHTATTQLGIMRKETEEAEKKLVELDRGMARAKEAAASTASQQHDAQLRLQTATAALDDVTIRSTALQHKVDSLTLQLETEHAASTDTIASLQQHARKHASRCARLEQDIATSAAEQAELQRSLADTKQTEALLGARPTRPGARASDAELSGLRAQLATETQAHQEQVAKLNQELQLKASQAEDAEHHQHKSRLQLKTSQGSLDDATAMAEGLQANLDAVTKQAAADASSFAARKSVFQASHQKAKNKNSELERSLAGVAASSATQAKELTSVRQQLREAHAKVPYLSPAIPAFQVVSTMQSVWTLLVLI